MMPGVGARARAIVPTLMLALCVATLALCLAKYFVSLSTIGSGDPPEPVP